MSWYLSLHLSHAIKRRVRFSSSSHCWRVTRLRLAALAAPSHFVNILRMSSKKEYEYLVSVEGSNGVHTCAFDILITLH